MTVVNFKEAIRARLNRMADEQWAMQEALLFVPQSQIEAHLDRMNAHAREMSDLAGRLYENSDISRKGAKALSTEDDGPEAA